MKMRKKSPSEMLRGTLYHLWVKRGSQSDFDSYYRKYVNAMINRIKEKLI